MTNVSIYIVANEVDSSFYYNGGGDDYRASSPSQINFLIFCAVWSILAVAFLILSPRYDTQARHIGHKFAILAIDAVTAIFWFAGFIALAALIGVPDCGNDTVCGSLQASVAFGAFLW
jgi:Membrane-associating domain